MLGVTFVSLEPCSGPIKLYVASRKVGNSDIIAWFLDGVRTVAGSIYLPPSKSTMLAPRVAPKEKTLCVANRLKRLFSKR